MKKLYPIFLLFTVIILSVGSCSRKNVNIPTNEISVHYIDVGQGDAILISVNGKNLLVDSGPKDSRNSILNYLASLKIKKLDYVIATHPHEDHIGNMASIISKYDIGAFYSPKVYHTSKSFEGMIQSLVDKNMKVNVINSLTKSIDLGPNTKVTFFTPTKDATYENLNLYSPIFKIQYKNISFLFTGDAEVSTEKEALKNLTLLKSDILKIGHHGSTTSTSRDFFEAVSPASAIISVGIDNSYNHPSKKTLDLLNEQHTKVYRTDIDGTIVITSNGESISRSYPFK